MAHRNKETSQRLTFKHQLVNKPFKRAINGVMLQMLFGLICIFLIHGSLLHYDLHFKRLATSVTINPFSDIQKYNKRVYNERLSDKTESKALVGEDFGITFNKSSVSNFSPVVAFYFCSYSH